MPSICMALHLVYEEMKLNILYHDEHSEEILQVLACLARNINLPLYIDYYFRENPEVRKIVEEPSQLTDDQRKILNYPQYLRNNPVNVFQWIDDRIKGLAYEPFPVLKDVNFMTKNVIGAFVVLLENRSAADINWDVYLKKISATGHRSKQKLFPEVDNEHLAASTKSCFEKMVLFMSQIGIGIKDLDRLPFGICAPFRESIFQSRVSPPLDWPEPAYVLIGRQDLAKQATSTRKVAKSQSFASRDTSWQFKATKEEDDGMDCLDKKLLRLRFSDDLRIPEVRRLLQSSKPVRISIVQRPEVSDHDFIEEQETQLYSYSIRTSALPLGRGMFTLSTYHPVATEALPIPKLCLTGRAPPRNNTIDLTHIDTPANMKNWPQFHNGVAAGLRIANSSQIDSTWIIYNRLKNSEMTNEHAGFLMALGLNGHLSSLDTLNIHNYLCRGHEMTSLALLLGTSAAKRSTMDVNTTRLLSIHLDALLPPTSTELDIHHNVQVASLLGIGLVYQGTAHRHMAEVLLAEIGRPPGPEMENCMDRESYSLSAGLGLGLVMLGQGCEAAGLSDLNIADQLYNYMVGGHRHPMVGPHKDKFKTSSYLISEGDTVNVDVTGPGAIFALGMMFFNTKNKAVADWLKAPDTQYMLDYVRPDHIMLRVIAKGLVLWDFIQPTKEWIINHVPSIVSQYAFSAPKYRDDCHIDFETMSQAYLNIVSGCCMVIGLKFAGSANEAAYRVLLDFTKIFLKYLSNLTVCEQAGKSTVENCMVVVVLSLAMVMAGTGDLEVLRICRYLRSRVGQSHNYVLYGSYMAVSLAIGLLFLGGGRYSLSSTPEAVAIMLCAFYPKFPTHSNDNRYHLQAFRQLYVLAAEPRVLIPKDVDSGSLCYVPLEVKFKDCDAYKDKKFTCIAPCPLPELDNLEEIKVIGERYLPVSFHRDKNWNNLKNVLFSSGILQVKQRAGHLSYVEDARGHRSLVIQSLSTDGAARRTAKPEVIKYFTSDPRMLAFAEGVCNTDIEEEHDVMQLLSLILHECLTQEKPEILYTYIAIDQVTRLLESKCSIFDLWQVKIIMSYYGAINGTKKNYVLIHPEFLAAIRNRISDKLDNWLGDNLESVMQYILGSLPISDSRLPAFLLWNNFPNPFILEIVCDAKFPALCRKLLPFGLSVGNVMRLSRLLPSR